MQLTKIKQKILGYLNLNEYVTRAQLKKYLELKGFQISNRNLRLTVADLHNKDGFIIRSSNKGWRLARTRKDVEEAKAYLKKYMKKFSQRLRNIDRNYLRGTAKLFTV